MRSDRLDADLFGDLLTDLGEHARRIGDCRRGARRNGCAGLFAELPPLALYYARARRR